MFKLSIKTVLARKRRLFFTALSVVIGIAFLAGTFVFTDTIERTFDNLFADVNKNTDAFVRSAEEFELGFGQSTRNRLPADLVTTVAAVPGVSQAEVDIAGSAVLVGSDGKQLGREQGAPRFGMNIYGGELSPWIFVEGGLPGPDELVIDKGSFDNGDFALGDQVTVLSQGGSRQFPLVGVVRFGDADSPGGATFALFDNATAESFVGQPGKVDDIVAKGDGSLSEEELAQRVQAAMPEGVEVLTGQQITEENQSDVQKGLAFFNILLLVFAGVALFVGSFIIYNTFSIIVAQRQKENALLRAIGASRRQIIWSLLIESVIIGLVASVLGIAFGILTAMLLEAMLNALGITIPSSGLVLLPRTVIVSLIVGVGITVIAAVMPSIRASKVPPVAAMRDIEIYRSGTSHARLIWGVALTAIGAALLAIGLTASPLLLALAIPLIFIGVFVLGPLIARPVARFLGAPLPRLQGVTGTLARENSMRNPKRTARTAAALMVGVALVAGISVLAASIKTSIRSIFEDQFTGDFVVSTQSFGFGGLPVTVAEQLNELPEIAAATGVQLGVAKVDGKDTTVSAIDPATAGQIFELDYVAGSLEDLEDTTVQVSKSRADRDDLAIGSTLPLQFVDGTVRQLTVSGIYDRDDLAGPYTVSKGLYAQTGADQFDFSVFILTADGVTEDEARTAIESVAGAFPNAKVESRTEYIDSQAAQIDQFVNLVYALLALSVLIAIVGIANTLSLSVFERTHELGLVRAVGGTRTQVRRTIRWESVITALLGAVQGIAIGILLGWAVSLALRSEGLSRFSLPIVALIVVLLLAIVVGIVAAILPARRAARVDVLRAVTTE
jgi:putative ABC transport system permease protein